MNEITKPEAPTEVAQVTPIKEGPSEILAAIVQMARDPSVDADKLEKLLAMQERMEARQSERQFHSALQRIQARVPRVRRNGTVDLGPGKGSYRFATYEDVMTVVSPLLDEEGMTVTFGEIARDQNGIRWRATWRAFGHTEFNEMTLPPDTGHGRNALQAAGSTSSYAKRYLVEDFCKIVREDADDDGKRGGTKHISEAQVREIIDGLKEIGRQEGPFLDHLFAGQIRSVEEIEDGQAFLTAMSTINGIKRRQQKEKSI